MATPQCKNCKFFEQVSSKYGTCSSLGKPDGFRFSYNGRKLFPVVAYFGVCNQHEAGKNTFVKKNTFSDLENFKVG